MPIGVKGEGEASSGVVDAVDGERRDVEDAFGEGVLLLLPTPGRDSREIVGVDRRGVFCEGIVGLLGSTDAVDSSVSSSESSRPLGYSCQDCMVW